MAVRLRDMEGIHVPGAGAALSGRQGQIIAPFASTIAAGTIAEVPIGKVPQGAVIVGAFVSMNGAVNADAANNATFTIKRYAADGSGATTLFSRTTTAAGTGNIAAFQALSLGDPSNQFAVDDAPLTFALTKNGTGVATFAGAVTIEYRALAGPVFAPVTDGLILDCANHPYHTVIDRIAVEIVTAGTKGNSTTFLQTLTAKFGSVILSDPVVLMNAAFAGAPPAAGVLLGAAGREVIVPPGGRIDLVYNESGTIGSATRAAFRLRDWSFNKRRAIEPILG